jgi:TonB family protein
MLDRHFVEPADGNALALYRNVLKYDPNNGEAREALQRLAQVLVARVQSDLDAKKIDTATQALEAARSISPDDPRLAELDAHIETLRAEIGTAQIQAAINAGNLDRALQLLDGAERTKSLSGAKVSQLREQILRLQAQASSADPQAPAQASSKKVQHDLDAERDAQARQAKILAHTLELAQARLAQGKILEPDGDNALYYVNQVRASDPTLGGLAQTSNAIRSAILAQARTALDSQDTGKAELLLGAARGLGSSADIDALYDAFAQQKQKQSRAAAVAAAANSLVPLKPLKLDYPRAALESGTEGWVDVAFDVTPDGKVANITVVDASPRNVFDSAAKSALSRARFQPALVDGQAVVIRATRHIVFRMSKE